MAYQTATPFIDQPLVPVAAIQEGSIPREPARSLVAEAPARQVTSKERDAILEQLYDMRRELTRAKRLGQSTALDEARLSDVNAYIDHWETVEAPPEREDVWKKLEAMVPELLSIRASIKRAK